MHLQLEEGSLGGENQPEMQTCYAVEWPHSARCSTVRDSIRHGLIKCEQSQVHEQELILWGSKVGVGLALLPLSRLVSGVLF